MVSVDARYSGSVPANYERFLVPLLFRPYAEIMAERAESFHPSRILETAAGTGVVTAALAEAMPDAEIVATDLNQDMLDVAAARLASPRISFRQSDALELPFEDESFDLVVCQFGMMFFPDKVQGGREARRVLRPGGHYLIAVWDSIERNALSHLANQSMRQNFPENPPLFMERGPYGYHDPEWVAADLKAAGFSEICVDTIELPSRSPSAEDGARGLVYGSPMGLELADYGPGALDKVFDDLSRSAARYERANGFEAPMSAHIVTAAK